MRAAVLEQAEVLQRIAVDHQKIGKGAGFDHAELALLAHDLGADQGRRADDVDGGHHLAADLELAGLLVLERAQKIGTVGHLHAGLAAMLELGEAVLQHLVVLLQHLGRHAQFLGTALHGVVGHQIGDHVDALLGHQPGRGGIHQIAVLDGAHAAIDGAGDRLGRIGMGQHVATEGVRLLDGGGDLLDRELQRFQRVVGRGDAAGDHQLHLVGALAHLLAGGLAHLVRAVGDAADEHHAVAAETGRADVGAAVAVVVAAGRTDRAAGDEEARARDQARFDGGLGPPVGAAGIAHGGEAAIEHALQAPGGARHHQRQRHRLHAVDVDLAVMGMDVAVDQARHQGALAAIHDLGLGRLDRLGRDFLDAVALDQHFVAATRLFPARIEQIEILEQEHLRPTSTRSYETCRPS